MRTIFAALITTLSVAQTAHAGYIYTFQEVGNTVTLTGNGSLDTSGFSFLDNPTQNAFVDAGEADLAAGPTNGVVAQYLVGIDNTKPQSGPFGNGPFVFATSGKGDEVGLMYFYGGREAMVTLPIGYQSDTFLSSFSTFAQATYKSLGLFPGDYTYTLDGDQTFQIDVEPAALVGEPSSLALLGLPLFLVGVAVWHPQTRFKLFASPALPQQGM